MSTQSVKFIKSLQLKKFRKVHSCFFVEGKTNILEAINSNLKIKTLYLTKLGLEDINTFDFDGEIIELNEKQLIQAGTYKSNNYGLAVVEIPDFKTKDFVLCNEWALALDGVSDPGNLGTIIRTADWFGINTIYCSHDTVDMYAPKVINSTKGSFSRVKVIYTDLEEVLKNNDCYAAEMTGESLYEVDWAKKKQGVILMGNESHGVSKALSNLVNFSITIPKTGGAESLNVAVATSIICSYVTK